MKKITNINNAKFAIEDIIKIYKKIPPDYDDAGELFDRYKESFNYIQKKFPKRDLSLYKIEIHPEYVIADTREQFEEFRKKLIAKSEGLKDFLDSNIGKFDPEYKKIEERLKILEEQVKKFDERLNYAQGEINAFHDMRKDLKEIIKWYSTFKNKKPEK